MALKPFFQYEVTEAGCDEAGRGCLAGPVVGAAVILPKGFDHPGLNDSKKLSVKQREALRTEIEQTALSWAVTFVGPAEIDEINILNASYEAMHRSVSQLAVKPGLLLIDGNRFRPYPNVPHECIVKGDSLFQSIAAASILAKTHRDEYMKKLGDSHPHYNWTKNKGYPTKDHRTAIVHHGITVHHRKSFTLTR